MSRLTTARRRPAARRGTILVVVLALLTIFAVIGITFVFYSDGEMVAARYHRESETRNGVGRPDLPPFDTDAEAALFSVIFGADPADTTAQVTNAFRGHDLLTTIYGAQGKETALPYNGPGILHENLAKLTDTALATVSDRARVVNQTVMNVGGKYYVVDPEISGDLRDPKTRAPIKLDDGEIKNGTRFHVAKNAPYTYPDLNNFYLASISPATGEVLVPSYFRPWAFNDRPATLNGQTTPTPAPLGGRLARWDPNDPVLIANTDWVTAEGRAKILRPRPIDQLTDKELIAAWGQPRPPTEAEYSAAGFNAANLYKTIDDKIKAGDIIGYPRPNSDNSTTGDVFNYIGGVNTQRNDTILVDFGAAPIEWPAKSGKYIKPLAAVLVTDHDGLLNLNAHGNVRNSGNHLSYHGFGPWEVNLESATANKGEASTIVASRYGKWGSPGARNGSATQNLAFDPSGRRLGLYGQVNWDATGTPAMGTQAITIPSFATGANPFAVVPNYAGGFFDDNTDPKKAANHPALFNPADWGAFPEGQSLNPLPAGPNSAVPYGYTYSHADTRRLRQRYAGELDLYQQMTFNRLAGPPSGTLIGSYPAGPTYPKDPAHPRRGLFTTLSASHDQPTTMPQAQTSGTSFGLTDAGTYPPMTLPAPVHAANSGLTPGLSAGTFLGPVNLNRPLADYRKDKSIDLNSSNTDAATSNKPWADRYNLARDIFIRLVVSTGALNTKGVSIDSSGNLKLPGPSTNADYNGLRYLAQMAANIVDYIDGDDVSTMFVWNPEDSASTATPKEGLLVRVTDTSVVSTASTAMADPTKVGERVVFGVEVPRLVINEVYSEIVDDPNGMGKGMGKGKGSKSDGIARFWVELLNPASPVSPATAKDGVLGTGKVVLKDAGGIKPYKLTISRGTRNGTKAADDIRFNPANVAGNLPNGFGPDIDYDFSDAGGANSEVAPNNGKYDPAGDPAQGIVVVGPKVTGANPAEEYDPKQLTPVPAWATSMIETATAAPNGSGGPNGGGGVNGMEYRLTNAELKALDQTKATSEFRRHVVLLRRLANPYIAADPATNPYITVDVMDWVTSNDAVFTGNGGGMGNGGLPIAQRVALGRVQPYAGHSYPDDPNAGTVLKYSFPTSATIAQAPATPGANEPLHTLGRHNGKSATAPTAETVTPASPAPTTGLSDTVMAPYDWLVHLDRPLVNQLELLHLQAVKPHEVTYYFLQPPAAAGEGVRKQVGQAPWFGIAPTGATAPQVEGHPFTLQTRSAIDTTATGRSNNGLFRGFEFLRSKPWTYGQASGGRVHGKLNLNTIQDIRVWNALSDPQATNGFTQADSDKLWTTFFTSPDTGGTAGRGVRTWTGLKKTDAINQNWTVPSPGETIDDTDPFIDTDVKKYTARLATLDRPFKPFGAADAPPPSAAKTWPPTGVVVAPAGSGLQDTILRVDADPNQKTVTGRPLLWPPVPTAAGTPPHPYQEAELARKLLNNATTVSNVFTVHITVVYHEVRMDPTVSPPAQMYESINVETSYTGTPAPKEKKRYYLGRESYRDVPGDMRQQYLAIVDRSNALVQPPTFTGGTMTGTQDLAPTPFHASLATDLLVTDLKMSLLNSEMNSAGTSVIVYADGQPVEVNTGTKLRIGTGPDADWVEVTSVANNKGVYEINFKNADSTKTGLQRPHQAGEVVTNASFGRPVQPPSPPNAFSPIKSPDEFRQKGYPLFIPYASRIR